MMPRLRGLGAAAVLLAILAGLPAVLLLTGTYPDHLPNLAEVNQALRTPDDGTIALGAITIVGWLAWLVLAAAILAEIGARVRGVRAPRLPVGMGWAQHLARTLVTAAALTFSLAAPTVVHAAPAPARPAASAPVSATPVTGTPPTHTPAASTPAASDHPQGWQPYTVQRGDTLWSLAADRLGAGERFRELAAANREVLGDRAGFLQPGWVLHLPKAPANDTANTSDAEQLVVVEPGDTLSGIAADHLGDPDRYDELAATTAPITQPDGDHLTDPDLIRPGWRIVIPADSAHETTPGQERDAPTGQGEEAPPPSTLHAVPEPTIAPAPEVSRALPSAPAVAPAPATARSVAPPATPASQRAPSVEDRPAIAASGLPGAPWVVAGLTGSGAVLAGALLLLVRRRRQAAFRARRPGRATPPIPVELQPVERTLATYGAPATVAIETIDAVLRSLAHRLREDGQDLPDLAALELDAATITAHLATPGQLPSPWRALEEGGRRFVWDTDSPIKVSDTELADQPPPWPMLVTIGAATEGHLWLLNAEAYPVLHVRGSSQHAEDFTRHLVAELATSPWARDLSIDCVDLLPELTPLDPRRLHHHTDPTAAITTAAQDADDALDRAGHDGVSCLATARAHQIGDDLWPARLLVTRPTGAGLTALLARLGEGGPAGVTVLLAGDGSEVTGATDLILGETTLTLPDFGLTLTPVQLTRDEGAGCAALVAGHSDLQDVPMPAPADPVTALDAVTAVDGSIREDLVQDRHDDTGETTSLLNQPDPDYLEAAAATTAEDLATLAPRVPTEIAAAVVNADPDLDADLAAWNAPACDLPRLTLLGPVHARTHGDPYAATERKAYYTELLAWFALHPGGGTSEQLRNAFSISANRVRVDVKAVRDWLGVNPRTGTKHLPDARESAAGKAQGRGVYQVEGLLTDLDLFKRLRARGAARGGEAGMTDLATALTLVTGAPFTGCREGGWGWLFEGDRVDEHMVCAIVDVAHLVVTDALHRGDTALANAAAQVAAQAAPYADTPKLDLAAIARAQGRMSDSAAIIKEDVCEWTNEAGTPPTELPERTRQILAGDAFTAKAS